MGVDVVSDFSYFERTMADSTRSVTELREIAVAHCIMVNLHCDEKNDKLSHHIK